MAKKPTTFVVTANRTEDGVTVYRDAAGNWTPQFVKAAVHGDEASTEAALAAARKEERLVCDPYAFPVGLDAAGVPVALSAREQIRASGPTCRVRRPDDQLRA